MDVQTVRQINGVHQQTQLLPAVPVQLEKGQTLEKEHKKVTAHGVSCCFLKIGKTEELHPEIYVDLTNAIIYANKHGSIQIARPVCEQLFARTVVTRSYDQS